jgi:hypothetical protein
MWVEIALAETKAVTPTEKPGFADDEIAPAAPRRFAVEPSIGDAANARFPTTLPIQPATKSPAN